MNMYKYILMLAAMLCIISCSEDSGNGAGDATVGFEQATYSFRESEGTVRIPVRFTGEPKKYPITFSIEATVDPQKGMVDNHPVTVDEVAHFIQLEDFHYIGNPNAPVFIEVDLKDNDVVNDLRYLTLAIVSVDGAEVVNGKTTIEIRDNDADNYDRLQGRWSFKTTDLDTGRPNPSTITYILGGFTDEEIAENRANNRLVCYGFGGFNDTPGGVHFLWYLNYEYDEVSGTGSLSLDMTRPLINVNEDVFGVGVNPTMVLFSTMPADSKDHNVDLSTPIYANWSDDCRTITFDPKTALVPLIFSNGNFTNMTMGTLGKITMTRAD